MKLSRKLTLSFILSILFSILIISIISNIMINNRFDTYLIEERGERFETIRKDINDLFIEKNESITDDDIDNYALREGIYLEVRGLNDDTICHSNRHPRSLRRGTMSPMMRKHHGIMNPNFKDNTGRYVEKTFPLINNGKNVASLIIGYIDNSHLTESALIFKNTLAHSFTLSGIITVILGFLISILLAKSLSKPLLNITNTANQIRKGNIQSRSNIKTNTKEIIDLSNSINYLGETLEKQENLRRRYALDIAHELRTPLTTLKSHVEAMIDKVWKPDEEKLTILMCEVERFAKLIENLNKTFNSQEIQISINRTRFNLSQELNYIISTFIPIFEKQKLTLQTFIEEDIEISMDKDRLNQIVSNLLSNSIKYIGDGDTIIIRLKDSKHNIEIIIEDNGIGIKEEDLPHIFERFYRSDLSRNDRTGSTGLGLAIVKSLVEAHGGSILVESQLNKGTKFTIELPVNTS